MTMNEYCQLIIERGEIERLVHDFFETDRKLSLAYMERVLDLDEEIKQAQIYLNLGVKAA